MKSGMGQEDRKRQDFQRSTHGLHLPDVAMKSPA